MTTVNRRNLLLGSLAGAVPAALAASSAHAQDQAGRLTEEQLGQVIAAIGLQPNKRDKRYDFAFQAQLNDQTWELSMSAVLSANGESIWLMAWLDELPKASNDVPRTALLRLLAENDQMGDGKFFAYIPANRRFVLQRTVPNEGLTSAKLRLLLQDLGSSVVETYPIWHTGNWGGTPAAPVGTTSTSPAGGTPVRSAVNDSKFEQPVRR